MNLLAPILLASFLPVPLPPQGTTQKPPWRHTRTGRITLPPPAPKQATKPQEKARPRTDLETFHRDVIDLRRSKVLQPAVEERLLATLQQRYEDPARMAVELAPRCKNDLLFGLMKVVDRYGDKYHAEQLHFQILTRPMGSVTSRVVQTVIRKSSSERARSFLFDYLTAKFAPVRAAATEFLPDHLTADDVPELLRLSREPKADVRRKVIEIMAGIDDPRVRKRVLQVLAQDPPLAPDACVAAIAHGEAVVADLAAMVAKPARDHAFGYAAFALARIEKALGKPVLTAAMVPHLVRELRGRDRLLKSTSAIALGTLAYRATDWPNHAQEDKQIVDGLLDLVAPEDFVSSLQLLQPLAHEILVKFTGRNYQSRGSAWRGWWEETRSDFVGLRRAVAVTAANAERAHVTWVTGKHALSFRGPQVPAETVPREAQPYILSGAQMLELVGKLGELGFMVAGDLPRTPEPWAIDLRVEDARTVMRVDPERGQDFHRNFVAVARREMWQRHRDPQAQPDATAFWRMERKWLEQHPGEEARRLVWHIVRRLPGLDVADRAKALDDLQSVPGLPKLLTEEDGAKLVAVARALPKIEDGDFRLLEIALLAPGDTTWRHAIGVLDGRLRGLRDELASRLFRVLGPEKVVTTIRHKNGAIATAAMLDAATNRNQGAVPNLMDRLRDGDPDVRRTAIFALGALHATQARDFLVRYEREASPVLRREVWGALGRIGGPGVPAILKRAMENPSLDDKLAALAAMGHTQSEEIALFLAARFVTQAAVQDAFSQRAEVSLRQMGPLLAAPALRPHLQMQDGPARQRLVLLLGEFHDPFVVRDLIDLLRDERHEANAARLLAEITGVDLRGVNERARQMFAWYAQNRGKSPAEWFLAALRGARIQTALKVEHLTRRSGVGAVEELTRLLMEVEPPRLRVMVGTMLRETTGKDFTRGLRYATEAALVSIADRYKIYASTVRSAAK